MQYMYNKICCMKFFQMNRNKTRKKKNKETRLKKKKDMSSLPKTM